jgi:mono/diheme cytochrome c family protein
LTARNIAVLLVVLAAGLVFHRWSFVSAPEAPQSSSGLPMVEVTVPALSAAETKGRTGFEANCASCHGVNAGGLEGRGPPLVHKIYEPGHHADAAFFLAVKNGVRSHHWRFGDMPPVPGVADSDIGAIVAFVRALQRANGIN